MDIFVKDNAHYINLAKGREFAGITLEKGLNHLSDETWARIKNHPWVKHLQDNGLLTIGTPEIIEIENPPEIIPDGAVREE